MSLPVQCRHGVMKKFCSDCHPERKDLQKKGTGRMKENHEQELSNVLLRFWLVVFGIISIIYVICKTLF